MKYIVMECHEGYAVLMDEESCFVKAANLHYEVGQTVTDPIIMGAEKSERRISMSVGKIAAAAAGLLIFISAGSLYYNRNLKTHLTVMISSDANVSIEVNKKGKVIKITSEDEKIREMLRDYDGMGKDSLTAANEIIALEKEKGIISEDETVNVYVKSESSEEYSSFKSNLESNVPDVKVNVHGNDEPKPPAESNENTKKPTPPEPPKPKETATPEPVKPPEIKETAPQPPAEEPPAPAVEPSKHDKDGRKVHEPPKVPEKHEENRDAESVKPAEPSEPPKPPKPGIEETKHPDVPHPPHEEPAAGAEEKTPHPEDDIHTPLQK